MCVQCARTQESGLRSDATHAFGARRRSRDPARRFWMRERRGAARRRDVRDAYTQMDLWSFYVGFIFEMVGSIVFRKQCEILDKEG